MAKKSTLAIIILWLLSLALIGGGIYLHSTRGRYSEHKWHEGYAEDIIYDVMENYVYPGAPAENAEKYLGEGSTDTGIAEKLTAPLIYAAATDCRTLVYKIHRGMNESGNIGNKYFIVILDDSTVLETMLLDSLEILG